jgi:hypothetical protein
MKAQTFAITDASAAQPAAGELALLLDRSQVVGLLVAEAGLPELSVRTWSLEGALELLARAASPGPLGRAVARWDNPSNAGRTRFAGLPRVQAQLAAAGHLRATGGHYCVEPDWWAEHERLIELLPAEERALLARVAQRLVAMATISSNSRATASLSS